MAATLDFRTPTYIPDMEQFMAVAMTGLEVWGRTWTECFDKLTGANGVTIEHAAKNPDEDPFVADYEALAAEEPTSQVRDAADAAGYPSIW